MSIASYNFKVKHGNSGVIGNSNGIALTIKEGTVLKDLTGHTFHFFVEKQGIVFISKTSAASEILVNLITSEVTIPLSVTEVRSIPTAQIVNFELEMRKTSVSTQETIIEGQLVASVGINND